MSTDGHTPTRVWILAGLMVFLWAVNFLVAKVALRHFPPMLLAALRLTLAGAVIAPIYLWKRRAAGLSTSGGPLTANDEDPSVAGRLRSRFRRLLHGTPSVSEWAARRSSEEHAHNGAARRAGDSASSSTLGGAARALCASEQPKPLDRGLLPRLLVIGVLGVGMNQVFFTIGIGRTSVAHAALIIALGPVFAFLISTAIGQEQFTLRKAAGLAVAFLGVALLQRAPDGARTATASGDFLIFLAGFTFSAFAVASKSIRSKFDGLTMTTSAYAGSAVVLLPVTLWQSRSFSYASVGITGWVAVAYMALVSSLVCYGIFYYAMHYMSVTRLSAFAYLQPLFATGLAVPLLGETLTSSLIGAGVLVLFGVFLTERS